MSGTIQKRHIEKTATLFEGPHRDDWPKWVLYWLETGRIGSGPKSMLMTAVAQAIADADAEAEGYERGKRDEQQRDAVRDYVWPEATKEQP